MRVIHPSLFLVMKRFAAEVSYQRILSIHLPELPKMYRSALTLAESKSAEALDRHRGLSGDCVHVYGRDQGNRLIDG
jgi:hypothetical protein